MSETPPSNDQDKQDSAIETLEAENEELRERLDELETALGTSQSDGENDGEAPIPMSRRGALAALAGAGVVGVGATGTAAAQSDHDHLGQSWVGSPGTRGLTVDLRNAGNAFVGIAGRDTNDTSDIGVVGRTFSTSGDAVFGHATQSTGDTRGIVGRVDSPDGIALEGRVRTSTAGNSRAINGLNEADDGTAIRGVATGNGNTIGIIGETFSSNGIGIYTPDDASVDGAMDVSGEIHAHDNVIIDSGGEIMINDGGSLNVSGTKHFVHAVHTPGEPQKKVRYTSVESGKALTEVSEVAEMVDGRAEIELPEHFEMVTSSDEPLSIQVTPYADEEVKPQVVEESTDSIVVEDFSDHPGQYTFAYTVKGVREGYENEEIVIEEG